jgi:hypothetical protein
MEELSIRTTRRGKLNEDPFLNVKNMNEGKNFIGCVYRVLQEDTNPNWINTNCFASMSHSNYPIKTVLEMCVYKKYTIYDKSMILQYINALNKLKVFLKIEFVGEDDDYYVIKIFKTKNSDYITKKEFLAAASAVRYLYESGSGSFGDKRTIPYFFLYLNKFKELLPLEKLFLAHCCKQFNFYGTGHCLYYTKEMLPKTDVNEIKEMLHIGRELTSSFTSKKVSGFIPSSYQTRAKLDELVQKFITYKKNGF